MSAFYDDLVFPYKISLFDFKGRRSRSTSIVQTRAGYIQTKSQWAQTKRSWDAGLVVRPVSLWNLVDDFFDIVEGRGIGFLLRDPTDYKVARENGVLVQVSGDIYSLQKARTIGAHTSYRAIGKPKASTVVVYKTNAGVTTTVTPTDYTVNGTNDKVTFDPGYVSVGDTFTFSCEFFNAARFGTDDLEWEAVNKKPGQTGELLIKSGSIPINEDPQSDVFYVPPT